MSKEINTPPVESVIKDTPIREAIKDALRDTKVSPEGKTSTEPPVEAPPAEPKDEPKSEDKPIEGNKSGLSDEQQEAAYNLYRALANNDPKIQTQALEMLAKAANFELKSIETKKDIVEAKKDLTSLLKEGLGEFDFLADKLGPILDKVLKDYVTENTQDIRTHQAATERARQEAIVNDAIDTVFNTYTLDDASKATLVKEMESLMDSFQPGKNTSHQQYFKALITLAAENKGISLKSTNTKTLVDKITKNRNDAAGRIASERGAEVKEVTRTTGFRNLRDAIKDAVEKSQVERR